MSGFFSFLLVLALALVAIGGSLGQRMRAPGPLETDKVVVIAPRTDVQDILAQLENDGVIDNAWLLNGALLVDGKRSSVKAGEYLFKAHASMRDVIDTLVSGHQILHKITIPEGLTSEQIVDILKENDFKDGGDLLTGDITDMPKEGSLLPETYLVARGMSRMDLIHKMQDDQKKALAQIWARRSPDLPLRSPFEMLVLASIVEKETGKADERPRVAGVFINRLQKRMKLQSDPTIVYGLVGGKGTLGRAIQRAEVARPTPYNTYVIEGLPPGPIANPGRAALEAVANPSRTKELYFVADGTGGHAFAETIDQHNKNVARWRQIEHDRQAAQPPAVDHADPETAPNAVPLLRDQRGEGTSVPIYGGLSPVQGVAPPTAQAYAEPGAQLSSPAILATDKARSLAPVLATTAPPPPVSVAPPAGDASAANRPKPLSVYAIGGGIDQSVSAQLGMASDALDGPSDAAGDIAIDPGSYPESPQRRAEQKARAAKFGVAPGADSLPSPELAATDNEAQAPAPLATTPRVVKVYDASEGTTFDPLRDKTWDLNSPKTVPNLDMGAPAAHPPSAAVKPRPKPAKSAARQPASRIPAPAPAATPE